jgi:uncharacterized protein with gpF-like domain
MSSNRKRDEVKSSLERKGFRQKESDHSLFFYYSKAGNKTTVVTKTSHGTKYKVLYEPLIAEMAKQCRLKKDDFLKLIDCPMTQDDYEKKLEGKNVKL